MLSNHFYYKTNLVGIKWLQLQTLTKDLILDLIFSFFFPMLLLTLRGYLSIPATRACPYGFSDVPSSQFCRGNKHVIFIIKHKKSCRSQKHQNTNYQIYNYIPSEFDTTFTFSHNIYNLKNALQCLCQVVRFTNVICLVFTQDTNFRYQANTNLNDDSLSASKTSTKDQHNFARF